MGFQNPKKTPVLLCAVLALGAVCLFWRFIHTYFTGDDFIHLFLYHKMPFFELFTEPSLKRLSPCLYRPVSDLAIYIESVLFGITAFPYHIVLLVLHAANIFLLFHVAQRIIGSLGAAAAVILFAWHPVVPGLLAHNSSGIRNTLLLLFVLLCIDSLARFRRNGKPVHLLLSALFMGLATGTQPLITMPAVLILCDLAKQPSKNSHAPAAGRIRRIAHHLPLWAAFALVIWVGKTVTGSFPFPWSGSLPAAPPSETGFVQACSQILSRIESFCINPAMAGLVPEAVARLGRILILSLLVVSAGIWTRCLGKEFIRPLLTAALILPAAAAPFALNSGPDPVFARNFYLPAAAFCVLLGLALSGGPSARFRKSGALPLALALAVSFYYGCLSHAMSQPLVRAGGLTEKIIEQVHDLIEKNEQLGEGPVFLANTPHYISRRISGMNETERIMAEVFPSGLSMAFSPPFSSISTRIYPFSDKPWLSEELHVPFMLQMWSNGTVLDFDQYLDRVMILDYGKRRIALLLEYGRQYGKGKIRAIMPLAKPVQNMIVKIESDGFHIKLPAKMAKSYRAGLLTRHGPMVLTVNSLEKEMITWMNEKPYINLYFDSPLLRENLVYFDNEPVFLWVEILDEHGEVFHRSKPIRFRIRAGTGTGTGK